MKGDPKVIELLQTALTMELTAVRQYFLHAHIPEDWGLPALAEKMREEMAEEMAHADAFIERIMFLEGDPDVRSTNTVARAQSLLDIFSGDLSDENEARRFYTEASAAALAAGDLGSHELFKTTALDEEGHIEWLEGRISLLERLGEASFQLLYASTTSEPNT